MNIKKGITIWSLMVASILPISSKAQEITNKTNSDLIENIDIEINHETIINTSIKDIIEKYGESEGLNIINKHLMIEINKIRKEYNIGELNGIDANLKNFTQNQAEFLNNEGKIYHMKGDDLLWKRLKRNGFTFATCGENLALGQKTIKKVTIDRLNSPTHKANLLKMTYKKMGLGYKDGTWVVNRIG